MEMRVLMPPTFLWIAVGVGADGLNRAELVKLRRRCSLHCSKDRENILTPERESDILLAERRFCDGQNTFVELGNVRLHIYVGREKSAYDDG